MLRKSKWCRAGSTFLDAVFRKRYKKVYNIETSLCFIIQEDQNNDILKCLSQILSKIQKRISSTKTTLPGRGVKDSHKTVLQRVANPMIQTTDNPQLGLKKTWHIFYAAKWYVERHHTIQLTDILQHTFKHCHQETLRRMSCANLRKID